MVFVTSMKFSICRFFFVRAGMMGWLLINLSVLGKCFEHGSLSQSMILYQLFCLVICNDILSLINMIYNRCYGYWLFYHVTCLFSCTSLITLFMKNTWHLRKFISCSNKKYQASYCVIPFSLVAERFYIII